MYVCATLKKGEAVKSQYCSTWEQARNSIAPPGVIRSSRLRFVQQLALPARIDEAHPSGGMGWPTVVCRATAMYIMHIVMPMVCQRLMPRLTSMYEKVVDALREVGDPGLQGGPVQHLTLDAAPQVRGYLIPI